MRRLIAAHRLRDVVSYGGALAYAEALRAYAKVAVYVLPSVDEPFAMTVIEGLSAGTPVVCTVTCGIADEVAHRGAAIVTAGPRAMVEDIYRNLPRLGIHLNGHRCVRGCRMPHRII